MPIRILLADDHGIIREGLHHLLSSEDQMQIVGEADNGASAVHLTAQLRPDVVIMDISMPDLAGEEATRKIVAQCPGVKVVGLSAFDDTGRITAILDAGALGFVRKDEIFESLADAIRSIAAGKVYISPKAKVSLEARGRTRT